MSRLDGVNRYATEQRDRKINTIIPPALYWILSDAEEGIASIVCRAHSGEVFWKWLEKFLKEIEYV